jgi:hypothetical protein
MQIIKLKRMGLRDMHTLNETIEKKKLDPNDRDKIEM